MYSEFPAPVVMLELPLLHKVPAVGITILTFDLPPLRRCVSGVESASVTASRVGVIGTDTWTEASPVAGCERWCGEVCVPEVWVCGGTGGGVVCVLALEPPQNYTLEAQ